MVNCGAVWGVFLSAFVLALLGEFDHLDLGYLKVIMVITILAATAWIWWLPMRAARQRLRSGGP
jgi:hypothetical protein